MWHLSVEAVLLETAPPPIYQVIAARAKQLSRLGLSNVQIGRALGVSDIQALRRHRRQVPVETSKPQALRDGVCHFGASAPDLAADRDGEWRGCEH